MGIVDPRPALEERFKQELAELKRLYPEEQSFWTRRRFNRAKRRLRRKIFGGAAPTANW
jgi:hypothetical protein